jgi:microcystin-dependent protein
VSQPFVGEIRDFGFNFAPAGWMTCSGQLLAISDYSTLFQLIGTTYGGDGQNTFGLPDLRGRVGIHQGTAPSGSNYVLAQNGGVENVTLLASQIPAHSHAVNGNSNVANAESPGNTYPAGTAATGGNSYSNSTDGTKLNPGMIAPTGGNQPHNNLQPHLTTNYCISVYGIFPSQF